MVAIVSRRVTVFWLPDSRPQSHALQTSQKEAMPPRSRVAKPADDGNDDEEDRPIDVDAANAPSILGIGGQALPYKPAPSSPFPRDVGYISVEYPGFVANIDKVYETLGGKEAIVKVTSSAASFLELRFRPSDPFSHPIVGDAIDTSNLLLKVTRRRRKAKDGRPPGPWEEESQEILGEIGKTVRFRAMADYQFTPDPSFNTVQLRHAMQNVDVTQMFDLMFRTDEVQGNNLRNIPPPIFSRIDVPQNYGFRQNPAVIKVEDANAPDGYRLLNKQKAQRLVAHIFDPKSNTVPTEPPAQAARDTAKLDATHVALVKTLFEQRPVWSRLGIINSIPTEARKYIKKLLPTAAYFVSAGPFRESWIRYGYDFRREPEARRYQTVDVRFVKEARPLARAKRLLEGKAARGVVKDTEAQPEEEDRESHIFDGVHRKQITLYQLADLREPKLVNMYSTNTDVRPRYDDKDGWFVKGKLEAIREELRAQYLKLANRTDERPRVVAARETKAARRKSAKTKSTAGGDEESEEEDAPTTTTRKAKGKGKEKERPQGVRPVMTSKELDAKVNALMRNLNQTALASSAMTGTSVGASSGSEDQDDEDEDDEEGLVGSEEEEEQEGEEDEEPAELPDFYDDIFGGDDEDDEE